MTKTLAKFEDWPFRVPNFQEVGRKVDEITDLLKAAPDYKTALTIYKKMNKLMDKVMDDCTHIQVLYSLETHNEKYVKGNLKMDEEMPSLSVKINNFNKAMLASPFRPELEKKLGSLLFTMYEYSLKAFDERVVEEAQEENRLVSLYSQTTAGFRIKFRGEEYNMSQMGKFLTSSDRETRREASEVYYSYLDTKIDILEDIYDKLVKVRDKMAKKLGYQNYVELGYIKMNRFDYTPEMVRNYREQIHDVVTPISEKLSREQKKLLGVAKLKVYDLSSWFQKGNPVPKGTTEKKVELAQKMYDELSPDTSCFFRFMNEHHLMFLDAKPGKQGGGYMTYFPVHGCPIIFSNFNGTSGDVDVLTHEFGHSFQAYMARKIKVPEYRMPTMESCEIDSMSMEFFAEPYMGLFFDKPDEYRYTHLADAIRFLPYGVTVDEFQHWVYEHPEASPAERDAAWHELEEKYTPYKAKAYKGCHYMETGHRWLTQSHIFASPFYYIDYTLAQVVAFMFFNLDRKNHERAWKKYIKLCKLGGQYPFLTLLKKIGFKSPFEDGVVKKTIKPLVKVLKDYHPENF